MKRKIALNNEYKGYLYLIPSLVLKASGGVKMKRKRALSNENVGYIYLIPSLVFIVLFVGYPFFYNIMLALEDVNTFTFLQKNKDFIGLNNFNNGF